MHRSRTEPALLCANSADVRQPSAAAFGVAHPYVFCKSRDCEVGGQWLILCGSDVRINQRGEAKMKRPTPAVSDRDAGKRRTPIWVQRNKLTPAGLHEN
jgi:hypothetical protein